MAVPRHSVTTMILARVAVGIVALFVISSMLFLALELPPGDFADAILGRSSTPECLAAIREALRLNRAAQAVIIGAATVAASADFYDTVMILFDGSKLVGATLTARQLAAS